MEAARADHADPYSSNGVDQKESKDATLAMGSRSDFRCTRFIAKGCATCDSVIL